MNEAIAAEIRNWLLDSDEPLLAMYSIVREYVDSDLSLGDFLAAVDEMVIAGVFDLWMCDWPDTTPIRVTQLPDSLEQRYLDVGIPEPMNYDPLTFTLSLPPSQREPKAWHLHDDMESMEFTLDVRQGEPDEILAGVAKVRPEFMRVPTSERVEGAVRIISGDIRRVG